MSLCYATALVIFISYAVALALGRESCAAATFITGYDVNILRIDCVLGACEGCTVKYDLTFPGIPCTAGNPCAAPAPVPANSVNPSNPALDPTGTRGHIQGFYGLMFEGETAGQNAVVSVGNEQAVATDRGTIRCDGADVSKDAQFIMCYQASITKVHCGAGACSNRVVRTTVASTPWHCDPAQPITGNVNTPTPSPPGTRGSSFGPVAPGTELVVEAQELKSEKIKWQDGRYCLDDSLNGLTVYCGDFEACLDAIFDVNFGAGGAKRSLGQRVDGDWDQHVCFHAFQHLFCVDAADCLWAGQGRGLSHSFVDEAEPTMIHDDSDTATANLSLDALCGVQLSEQDAFADEKLNQDSKAEMNALAQEYKQELDLQCEAMVKWKDDRKKAKEKTAESEMMICVACIYLYPHRVHRPKYFQKRSGHNMDIFLHVQGSLRKKYMDLHLRRGNLNYIF